MNSKIFKRILGVTLAGTIAAAALTACGASNEAADTAAEAGSAEAAATAEETVVRIGAQPFPLYTPIYVAHERGYLQEELEAVGASYHWDEFQSGPLVNEAVAAGEEDVGFMADLPAIIAKSTGQEIEIVSNVAYGEQALAVLIPADSEISSVADLKGKTIGYATGSYAQHLLALLLEGEGLTLDDVQSINLGAGDQPAALANGEVDAIVIWEQYISQLTSEGTAKVLADGTGIKKGNMITYFVSEYAEAHPEIVEAYIKALNRANEDLESDPAGCAADVAEDFSVSAELMEQIIQKFTFKTALDEDDIQEITAVKDFSLNAGIIQNDVDMDSFINTQYVEEVNN
ncbi:MAG: aliphatic sulfonate ABC transporter substrate-binding protein [Butyricicoccus sp.]